MSFRIEEMSASHREQVQELLSRTFTAKREPFDPDRPAPDPETTLRLGAFAGEGRLVGTATTGHWGQWFAGHCVPMGSVSAVAISPEARGTGVGHALMEESVRWMRDRGIAVSTLYPATTSFYRDLGWEIAGMWRERRVRAAALAALPRPTDAPDIVRVDHAEALPSMRGVYEVVAPSAHGWLDRDDFVWRYRQWQAQKEGGPHRSIMVANRDGSPTGYVSYHHVEEDPRFYGLAVDDLVAADAGTYLALLRLLGSNRSVTDLVTFAGADEDSLLLALPEQHVETVQDWRWMLRIIDVPAAIASRGYAEGLDARVELELTAVDADRAEIDAERWVLEVADGAASLERGGSGAVRLDIGALAAMYTSHLAVPQLARLGRVDATDEGQLASLGVIFAGPYPWMPDFF